MGGPKKGIETCPPWVTGDKQIHRRTFDQLDRVWFVGKHYPQSGQVVARKLSGSPPRRTLVLIIE